jgi:hypothetical protein
MVMVIILFVLTVFKAPDLAKSISWLAGFPNLPASIISIKSTFDWAVTDIPTQEELEKQYNEALSWAIIIKGKIVGWVEITKNKVDDLRETMSWAEGKIDDLKDTYNDAKDFIDQAWKKIEETKKIIEDTNKVMNDVQNMWNKTSSGSTK